MMGSILVGFDVVRKLMVSFTLLAKFAGGGMLVWLVNTMEISKETLLYKDVWY